jgi:hypothetical protein
MTEEILNGYLKSTNNTSANKGTYSLLKAGSVI